MVKMMGFQQYDLEIAFPDGGGLVLDQTEIVSPIKVRWGRDALEKSPSTRMIDLTIKLNLKRAQRSVKRLPRAQIWLTAWLDQIKIPLFVGFIDQALITQINARQIHAQLRAVEARSWGELANTMITGRPTLADGPAIKTFINAELRRKSLEKIEINGATPAGERLWHDKLPPKSPLSAITWCEAACTGWPNAHAAWSADGTAVAPTIYEPLDSIAGTSIPAEKIRAARTASLSIYNRIYAVMWKIDGNGASAENDRGIVRLLSEQNQGIGPPMKIIKSNMIASVSSKPQFTNPALELWRRQVTEPRKISITTHEIPLTPRTAWLYTPQEFYDRKITIQDDPIAQLFAASPNIGVIGGTLTIGHKTIQHDIHCIWV